MTKKEVVGKRTVSRRPCCSTTDAIPCPARHWGPATRCQWCGRTHLSHTEQGKDSEANPDTKGRGGKLSRWCVRLPMLTM